MEPYQGRYENLLISVWVRMQPNGRDMICSYQGQIRKDGDNDMASKFEWEVPAPEIPPIDISKLIEMIKEQEKINEQTDDEQQSYSKCSNLPAER